MFFVFLWILSFVVWRDLLRGEIQFCDVNKDIVFGTIVTLLAGIVTWELFRKITLIDYNGLF